MKSDLKKVFLPVLIMTAMVTCRAVDAQNTPSTQLPGSTVQEAIPQDGPELTVESVAAQMAAITADTGLEAPIKDSVLAKYQTALDLLKKQAVHKAKADQYRLAITSAPNETAQLEEQRRTLPSVQQFTAQQRPEIEALNSQAIQQRVEAEKTSLSVMKGKLEGLLEEQALLEKRRTEVIERLPIAQKELAQTIASLDAPEMAADPTSPGRSADRLGLQAREMQLRNEIEMLKQEQLSQSVRENLQKVKVDLLKRQIENAEAIQQLLVSTKNQQLKNEAQILFEEADAIYNRASDEPELQTLALDVKSLIGELEGVVRQQAPVARSLQDLGARLTRLEEEFDFIEAQLELGGKGEVIGQLLFELQSRILQRGTNADLTANLPDLDGTRLANLELGRNELEQRQIERELPEDAPADLKRLIAIRATVLDKLAGEYKSLMSGLSEIAQDNQAYQEDAEKGLRYVREQLFWIQSYPPVSWKTISDLPRGMRQISVIEIWKPLTDSIARTARNRPIIFFGVLAIVFGLIATRSRQILALQNLEQPTRRISTDRYLLSVKALFWTVLLSSPVALLFLLVWWSIAPDTRAGRWGWAVANASLYAALVIFLATFIAELGRPKGLGRVHFGWRSEITNKIRRKSVLFSVLFLPFMLLAVSTAQSDLYAASVGRVCFIVSQLIVLAFVWYLFGSPRGLLAKQTVEEVSTLFSQTRFIWYPVVLTLPVALIVLAGLGYFMTALFLSLEFFTTLAIIVAGTLAYHMAVRWYSLKARKLALSEALQRRQARLESAAARDGQDSSSELVTVHPEEEIQVDLGVLGDQTRHLLRMLTTLGVIVALAFLWANTIPVLAALEKTTLVGGFSLLSLVQAILVTIVTAVAAQNLPGLLELSILRSKTIDAGTRFAIARLCQYTLLAAGLAALFAILRIDWSKLGWIAAALSVGLGFGLQEVVANFVCGLILLFERPVRVGDIVTLENTTGTVTRIQMRATTITNWERQELIVPNKNLITGTILNWTLSTSICRIVLPVGVAYGTNTDKARQIMLDTALDHPNVLDDPRPFTTFEEFADSSMTLRLLCFIPNLDERLKLISDLHTEIDQRFNAAGIVIAFPQLDLRIRNSQELAEQEFPEQHGNVR